MGGLAQGLPHGRHTCAGHGYPGSVGQEQPSDPAAAALEGAGTPTYCSPINQAEIFAGIRPGEEAVTEAFFLARGEVVLDAEIGRRAGAYLARYAGSRGVRIADALIAAAASTSGLRLWTLNRRHYPMDDVRFHFP